MVGNGVGFNYSGVQSGTKICGDKAETNVPYFLVPMESLICTGRRRVLENSGGLWVLYKGAGQYWFILGTSKKPQSVWGGGGSGRN